MRPFLKTTASTALLLALSACASSPLKKKNEMRSFMAPTDASAPLNIRAHADYLFIKAEVLSREGEIEKAAELFENVIALDPSSAVVHVRLSAEYLKLNKSKEAIFHAEKALEKDPKNIDAHFALGGLYTSEKSYDKAISHYDSILALQPANSDAALYLGSLYAIVKDFKKAEQYYNSQLRNPEYSTPHLVHFYIGLMHMDQEGPKFLLAAEHAFKTSLELKPGYDDAVISLAKLYLLKKDLSKALEVCLEFQKQEGFNTKVADLITQAYIENGELDKAYDQLNYIAGYSSSSIEIEMKMALLLIEQKRFNLAASKLNALLAKFPKADSARYYLAGVYEESGDHDNAVSNYLLVPESSKHFSEAIVHAAYLLKGQGKINQALAVTAKGLKAKADSQIFIMRASLLNAKSDYLGAARLLEEGLRKHSENVEMLFQHAIMLDRLGKKEAMMAQMKKVLEIKPDHVQSMSYLAFSLAELNLNLPEAEDIARRAVDLAPQDAYVLDTLGWVLFKQKKLAEAITVLEKAYSFQPSSSIIAEHLADAYSMQSKTEKAKEMYNKAVGLTTDEGQADKIRSKLQELRS